MMRIEVICCSLVVLGLGQITQAFTSWRSPAHHDVPHAHRIRVREEVDRQQLSSIGALWAVPKRAGHRSTKGNQDDDSKSKKKKQNNKKKNPATFTTLSDLSASLRSDPAALRDTQAQNRSKRKSTAGGATTKKGRTRRSVRERGDRPQQAYVYAAQRKKQQQLGGEDATAGGGDDSSADSKGGAAVATAEHPNLVLARQLGMRLSPTPLQSQGCYPDSSDGLHARPRIVGEVRVAEDTDGAAAGAGDYAYVVYKPAGWSILEVGGRGGDPRCRINTGNAGKAGTGGGRIGNGGTNKKKNKKRIKDTYQDKGTDDEDSRQLTESDLASAMTPEELAAFRSEGGMRGLDFLAAEGGSSGSGSDKGGGEPGTWFEDDADVDYTKENEADDAPTLPAQDPTDAGISSDDHRSDALRLRTGHPSLVSWLKDHMAARGTPIRGGKYWRPVAGAVDIDDSGFVVLCPKDQVDNVHVDFATYVAVVGNAEKLAPRGKIARERLSTYDKDGVEIDIVSKLRTGRGDDNLLTAAVTLSDGFSSSSDVVKECQSQFGDGIRGDPSADPLDRRASRRLLHCGAILVSSLVHDDDVEAMEDPPDDIAALSERGEWGQDFVRGSYLGRTELRNDEELTTAYREINGAADGYPGWVVDRYGQWLSVQHNEVAGIGSRGPLPSIHDENTVGIYYFPTNPDRSAISTTKPSLLEGQIAPNVLPIKENGITYHANLEESFSTGIFLDQRPQRAWLARHCDSSTRVLNCFAHCGAFSVAAAVAGASTVSLDLDKKWLDRIQPQMEANGIADFDQRHDAIYGDCFDWLARLGKRGEQYDIVILDPPSTSVGGKKKKRWSVKQDMDELVALAAPLVRPGGLLWTTTNSASIRVDKYAKMCKKGLDAAGCGDAKLERIAPMAVDFSSIGSQPVKNLVWRI